MYGKLNCFNFSKVSNKGVTYSIVNNLVIICENTWQYSFVLQTMWLTRPGYRLIFSMLRSLCIVIFTLYLCHSVTLVTFKACNTSEDQTVEHRKSYISYRSNLPPNPTNCNILIQETKGFLTKVGVNYACKALEGENCQFIYDEYFEKAGPLSVFLRTATCDVEWPQYGAVSQEELLFPLAYFITAFTDARNLELMLATIFRPHNRFCLHIDPKSDPFFSRSVHQLLTCYGKRYPKSVPVPPCLCFTCISLLWKQS